MTIRALTSAPRFYREQVAAAAAEGLDDFDRFMFGPPPAMPDALIDLAYTIGARPDRIAAKRREWIITAERDIDGARRWCSVPVPYDLRDQPPAMMRGILERLAAEAEQLAGPAPTVRVLRANAEYLAGRAAIVCDRGYVYARIDGAELVSAIDPVDLRRGPAADDALARLAPLRRVSSAEDPPEWGDA